MIKFLDLKKITDSFQPELGIAIARVVDSGFFVRAREVKQFEEAFAAFIGTKYCVGVGNGFDALRLILKAWMLSGDLREGDEVIVPANTYVASILAVTENRLNPVLVEPDPETFNIDASLVEEKITSRTKVIMVVHLYGRNALCPELMRLSAKYHLRMLEDNAQAAGCFYDGQHTGSVGDAGAHSFFPTKNLGALGDAGAVTTNDPVLADAVRALGNYGSSKRGTNELGGVNSRLDELQAAILSLKLRRLESDNADRRRAAEFYLRHIDNEAIVLPDSPEVMREHVWHLFVVRCTQRDALQQYLAQHGVEGLIHYPVPPHRQKALEGMNQLSLPVTERIHEEVLSLPLSQVITERELQRVVEVVNGFRARGDREIGV